MNFLKNHRLALILGLCFFILKLPMLTVPNNPEELRDFDSYVLAAEGLKAYEDYVWTYGPLSPIFYGTALKIGSEKLIHLRIATLILWTCVAFFLAKILSIYFKHWLPVAIGTLFASGIFGYPSYSHNHVLANFGLVISLYYLLRYTNGEDKKYLWFSYWGLMICLFSRPVIMGYGACAAWITVFFWTVRSHWMGRVRYLSGFALISAFIYLSFEAYYGSHLYSAFIPGSWIINPIQGYPNIHWLIPSLFKTQSTLMVFLKEIRASLETILFYTHYFIWPTFILTLALNTNKTHLYRGAAICMLLGLLSGFDLLHYGMVNPLTGQALTVRGQYFFSYFALSLFLVLWPREWPLKMNLSGARAVSSVGVLGILCIWIYAPLAAGIYQITKSEWAPTSIATTQGIHIHNDRKFIFEASEFLSLRCRGEGQFFMPAYLPGFRHLVDCEDLFERDVYAFSRPGHYVYRRGESPYDKEGGYKNELVLRKRIEKYQPQFVVVDGGAPFLETTHEHYCPKAKFTFKEFGVPPRSIRVCYPKSSTNQLTANKI